MEDEEKRTPRFGASGRLLTFTNFLSFQNLGPCQDLDLLEIIVVFKQNPGQNILKIKLKHFHSLGNILTNHNFNLLENIWTNKNVKSRIFLFPQWLVFKHEICNLSPLTKSFLNISCESVQIATKNHISNFSMWQKILHGQCLRQIPPTSVKLILARYILSLNLFRFLEIFC